MSLALNILRFGKHNDEKNLTHSNACLGCTTGGIAECLLLGTPDCVGGRRLYCSCGEQRRALRFPDVVLQLGLPSVVVLVRANPLSWSTDHELRRAPRRTKWGGICHMVCNALGKPHIASWPQFLGGLADPAMNLQLPGTVGCVLKAVQTSTSIVTTTSSASTLATTLTRTLTTTSTSYSFDRTIQSTSSRADQPSSTTLTPQPTSMTSPEAAMGKGQVTVSTAQSPTPVSKLATSSGPPSVMTGSGTFGTSIGTITTSTGTGTTSTRTDISSMIPYANQRTSTLSTRSDAPPTSVTSTVTEVKGAASLFEVSRGTRISTNMAALSVFTTLTIIHTAQSCTIGV
ncbi:hypothetical protein PG993_006144 [Apiospora rasikravindrae]|uniref:Uncharacterized protein n=1 Tax=Apiospora rasikravindrae TaxID=990691 RepID=A0ABR1TD66_9PEZI